MRNRSQLSTPFYLELPQHIKRRWHQCRIGRARQDSVSPRKPRPFARRALLGMAVWIMLWDLAGQLLAYVVYTAACPARLPEPCATTLAVLLLISIVATVFAVRNPEIRRSADMSYLVLGGWVLVCILFLPQDRLSIQMWGDSLPVPFWPSQWQLFAQWIQSLAQGLGMDNGGVLPWLGLWLVIPFVYRGGRFQTRLLLFTSFASGVALSLGFEPVLFYNWFADALAIGFVLRWLGTTIAGLTRSRVDTDEHPASSVGRVSAGPEKPLFTVAEHLLEAIGDAVIWIGRALTGRKR